MNTKLRNKSQFRLSALVSTTQYVVKCQKIGHHKEYTGIKRKVLERSKKEALSLSQFIKRFSTEESCAEYLYQLKQGNVPTQFYHSHP